ncbi:MAG: hypothetical protein AAFR79_12735 [Pseudomonadota bacterium]
MTTVKERCDAELLTEDVIAHTRDCGRYGYPSAGRVLPANAATRIITGLARTVQAGALSAALAALSGQRVIRMGRTLTPVDGVDALTGLILLRRSPECIRSDYAPRAPRALLRGGIAQFNSALLNSEVSRLRMAAPRENNSPGRFLVQRPVTGWW